MIIPETDHLNIVEKYIILISNNRTPAGSFPAPPFKKWRYKTMKKYIIYYYPNKKMKNLRVTFTTFNTDYFINELQRLMKNNIRYEIGGIENVI